LLQPVVSSDSDAGWDSLPASEDPPVFFAEAEVEGRIFTTPSRAQSGFTTDDPSYEEVDVVGGVAKDTYRWKNFIRPSKVDPSIKETYSYVKNHDGKYNSHFHKHILHFKNEKKVLIGYNGDKAVGAHLPHGNATKSTRPYIPVSNVVLYKRVQALAGRKAKDVYKELINEPADPNVKMLTHPRSKEHVKAVQDRLQRPYNFLKDDLTACHRVGQMLPKYIHLESTLHDCFNYVLCHKEILEQYRKAIDLMPRDEPLIHHLDTTYEFNKKYLSVLSFCHPALVNR
jgi:hypothetical protein